MPPPASGSTSSTPRPVSSLATVPAGGRGRRRRRRRRRARGAAGLEATAPARRAELLWNLGTRIAELRGRARHARGARQRQDPRRRADRRHPALPRRSSATTPAGRRRSRARRSRPPAGSPSTSTRAREPVGVVGAIVPWNFPLLMCAYKARPGARRRQHDRPQARRADAAGGAAPRRPGRRGRLPARRRQRRHRRRARRPARRSPSHPGVDKVTFTGETTDRPEDPRGRRRAT